QAAAGALLVLDLKAGPQFSFLEPEHGFRPTPQIAVWIEDEGGNYIDTVYVTHDEATDGYQDGDGKTSGRPAALPVWRPKLPPAQCGSVDRARPPDTVTGASPQDNVYLVATSHTALERFAVLLEVNNSNDYNEYYRRDSFPDDPGYAHGGNPAQPSIVYRA